MPGPGPYSPAFIRAVNFVLDPNVEGSMQLSMDQSDPGNWTGGAPGKGDLKGSKGGISAAAYPQLDIASLTRESIVAIYWRDYWQRFSGDQLPPRLALCVLDCAVNQGVEGAVKTLQSALQLGVDGAMGPITITAARSLEQDTAIIVFMAARALRYARDKQLVTYGKGWYGRLMRCLMNASR